MIEFKSNDWTLSCTLVFHATFFFSNAKNAKGRLQYARSIHSNIPEVSLYSPDEDPQHHCYSMVKFAPVWLFYCYGLHSPPLPKQNTRETKPGDKANQLGA